MAGDHQHRGKGQNQATREKMNSILLIPPPPPTKISNSSQKVEGVFQQLLKAIPSVLSKQWLGHTSHMQHINPYKAQESPRVNFRGAGAFRARVRVCSSLGFNTVNHCTDLNLKFEPGCTHNINVTFKMPNCNTTYVLFIPDHIQKMEIYWN